MVAKKTGINEQGVSKRLEFMTKWNSCFGKVIGASYGRK
jgi:hypothetical protein